MRDLPSFNSALAQTEIYIHSLQKKIEDKISPEKLKNAADTVDKSKNFLKSIRGKTVPKFDQDNLNKILVDISALKRTVPKEKKETGIQHSEKFVRALKGLEKYLNGLKLQTEKAGAKLKIATVKSLQKLPPDIKIKGINKNSVKPDKDLSKHLSFASKGLTQMKRQVSKSPSRVKEAEFRKLTGILKKTDLALLKGMAFHKTIAPQSFPSTTQKLMGSILKEISFIQKRLDMEAGNQIIAGEMQSQAVAFRNTLDEFKARLRALKKLRRGTRVEAVEHEPESGKNR